MGADTSALAGVIAGLISPILTGVIKRLFGEGWPKTPMARFGVFVIFVVVATITTVIVGALAGTPMQTTSGSEAIAVAVAVGTFVYRAYQAALGGAPTD